MLPGVVAGLYAPEQALIPMAPLARAAGAELVVDAVTGLDPGQRLLHRAGGPPIPYDLLSIDTGARPELTSVPGAAAHTIPVKPIDRLLERLPALPRRKDARLAVVGGGAAGVELAFALRAHRGKGAPVTLVAGGAGLLPGFPQRLQRRARAAMAARGIALIEGAPVAEVTGEALHFGAPRPPLPAEAVLWATAAAAPSWHAASGLARDPAGFLCVNACLQAENRLDIFIAGDAAAFTPRPLPKSGVHAVRQGPVLAQNLFRAARGESLLPYRPQRDTLVLLSLSDGRALGTRNGLVFGGRWVWWWKDTIDRRFVSRYRS
jgi:selenide,water dikinase